MEISKLNRKDLFRDIISRLEFIKTNQLPGYFIAEQMIYGFINIVEIEDNKRNDIEILKNLCSGLPFKDIECFDEDTINLIYESFDEMKKLLAEKQNIVVTMDK